MIGSGPSLDIRELRELAGFPAIAFNRSFIAWPDWGFTPCYYACTVRESAELVIEYIEQILAFDGLQKIWLHPWFHRAEAARSDPRVDFVTPGNHCFGPADGFIGDYGNVGASSLQLLWYMGHRRVLLMGTDGRYQRRVGGPSINHFRHDYIPAGFSSRAPARTEAWLEAIADARAHGMELWLRSPGSALSQIAGLVPHTGPLKQAVDWLAL